MNNLKVYKRIIVLFIIHYSLFITPLRAGDTLTVLFTHDLHSHFNSEKGKGGFARLAAIADRIRSEAPDKTLLLDAGDVAMGTFFHTLFQSHFAEWQLMQRMGYDATCVGNHDFDFGVNALSRAINNTACAAPVILSTNLRGLPCTREYIVLEKAGYRIGIFSLLGKEALSESLIDEGALQIEDYEAGTGPIADPAALVTPLIYSSPIETARAMVKLLREKERADLVICLSHSGTHPQRRHSEDEKLARKVKGIDLIISGHSHTVLPVPLWIRKRTLLASAGAYGEYLGVVKVHKEGNKPVFSNYKLLCIDRNIPEAPHIKEEITRYQQLVEEQYLKPRGYRHFDDTIAYNPVRLPAEPDSTALGSLIAEAFSYAVQKASGQRPDVAVVPRGTIRADLHQGVVSPEELFNILSLGIGYDGAYAFPLLKAYITGRELRDLCEVDASIGRIMPEARLFFGGLRYEYNPNSLIFNRTKKIELKDSLGNYATPADDQLYSVVCGLYTAKMIGLVKGRSFNILSILPKDSEGVAVDNWEKLLVRDTSGAEVKEWVALANYLKSQPENGAGIPQIKFTERLEEQKIRQSGFSLHDEFKYLTQFGLYAYITIMLLCVTLLFLLNAIIRRIIKYKKNK